MNTTIHIIKTQIQNQYTFLYSDDEQLMIFAKFFFSLNICFIHLKKKIKKTARSTDTLELVSGLIELLAIAMPELGLKIYCDKYN